MIALTTFLLLAQLDAAPRRPYVSEIAVVQGFAPADHAAIVSLTYDPWVLAIHDLADGAEVRRIELEDPAFSYWEYAGVATTRLHARELVFVATTAKTADDQTTRRVVCVAPDGSVRRVAEFTSRESRLGVCVLHRRSGGVLVWRAPSDEPATHDRIGLVDLTSGARDPIELDVPAGTYFGRALVTLPDLDGDGSDELVVSAPWETTNACGGGAVHAYSGADLAPLWTTKCAGDFGTVLARVPDLDGDGRDDLAVTAPGTLRGANDVRRERQRELVYLVGSTNGVLIATVRMPDEQPMPVSFGCAITALGDVDADGTGDFAIGQFMAMRDDERSFGAAYVVSGKTRSVLSSVWGVEHENDFGCALAADRATGCLVVCDLNDVFVCAASGATCARERTLRLR